MDAHVRDCIVADYQDLIPLLTLPDSDDRHVLAAAIRSSAKVRRIDSWRHWEGDRPGWVKAGLVSFVAFVPLIEWHAG